MQVQRPLARRVDSQAVFCSLTGVGKDDTVVPGLTGSGGIVDAYFDDEPIQADLRVGARRLVTFLFHEDAARRRIYYYSSGDKCRNRRRRVSASSFESSGT